jgi:hypothetical protein
LKYRRTLVSLRAPSRNRRNTNSKIYAEINENLETLGPKSQNARKCNLKLVGGALKEAVHSYGNFFPNVQVPSAETLKRRGTYGFSGNPRRVVQLCRRGGMTGKRL